MVPRDLPRRVVPCRNRVVLTNLRRVKRQSAANAGSALHVPTAALWPTTPGNFYDIVGRRGMLAARIRLADNERFIAFGARSAYVVEKDADDVERLRRHPWP